MYTGDLIRALLFVGCVTLVYVSAAWCLVLSIRWRRQGHVPSRRTAVLRWAVLGLAAAGIVCVLYGYLIEPNRPAVTRVSFASPKLKPGTSVRIVHLSDLHAEATPRLEPRIPALVSALGPDIIVFTGDTLNTRAGIPTARKLFAALAAIAPVYTVRGNWDQFLGMNAFAGTPVHELHDGSAMLDIDGNPVILMGVADGAPAYIAPLTHSVPDDAFRVLLYHRPDQIESVARLDTVDLYCAGHTHGGQVALPGYGALVTFSRLGKKYEAGLYHVGHTYLYINRGLGMERDAPVRFFARPEITLIEIRPAK